MDGFTGCFRDGCDPELIEHRLSILIGQRVLAIALGYEGPNDYDVHRRDPAGGPWGCDAGKTIKGRKRHAMVIPTAGRW